MNLVATVFQAHLGELELMTALPQMEARLQSRGLPVPENALDVWTACRATYSAEERLRGGVATLEEIEAENVAMRAEGDRLRGEIERTRAEIAERTAELERRQAEADRIRAEIAQIQSETVRIQAEIDRERERVAELQKNRRDPYKLAAALICKYGIRARSTEPETPKNHAPHQEN